MIRLLAIPLLVLASLKIAAQPAAPGDSTQRLSKRVDFRLLGAPGPQQRPVLAKPFQASELPFFCRQEYRLEQQIHIPVRLRMGSLEHSDFLEGKHRQP